MNSAPEKTARRQRVIRAAVIIIGVWLMLTAIKVAEGLINARMQGNDVVAGDLIKFDIPIAIAGMLTTPVALMVAFRFPITRATRRNIPVLAAFTVLLVFLLNTLRMVLWMLMGAVSADGFFIPLVFNMPAVFHIDLINVVAMLGAAHLILYIRQREASAARASKLETQLAEARLDALRFQLQPHFLFNSLHTIGQLVTTNRNREAVNVVELLGDLLRSTLDERRPSMIRLSEELDFIRRYLDIEMVRFSDRLTVEYDIEAGAEQSVIPSLLLQPLVENAIVHGIARSARGGTITIAARVENGVLHITVTDNGPGASPQSRTRQGVGLANVRGRLEAIYGDAAVLRTGDMQPHGFRATINMPYQTSDT